MILPSVAPEALPANQNLEMMQKFALVAGFVVLRRFVVLLRLAVRLRLHLVRYVAKLLNYSALRNDLGLTS